MAGAQVHGRRFGRPAVGRICNGLYPFPRDRGHPPAHAPLRGGARAAARSRSRQLRRSREHPPRCAARRTGQGQGRGSVGAAGAEGLRRHGAADRGLGRDVRGGEPLDLRPARVGTPAQKDKWLKPIVEGKVRSSFAMTEPAPGGGSDPGMIRTRAEKKGAGWVIHGHKWFITGAGVADHFILVARTSEDQRRGLTAFLYHRDQPGWRILRRIPIMGPEEHGGHCELVFEGLEVPDENVLMKVGDGLRVTQIRLGPARLTHCMRWLGLAKRAMEIAQAYVAQREGFGMRLGDRESVQINLGEVAQQIQIGRLLVMHAAWKLDQGDHARKEVSMAKVHVADTLHRAADVAIQLNGARGYSKDTILEWIYRYARQARLVDGASEVHNMVLARFMQDEGSDFWRWSAGNRV